jgi:hypothetical protein
MITLRGRHLVRTRSALTWVCALGGLGLAAGCGDDARAADPAANSDAGVSDDDPAAPRPAPPVITEPVTEGQLVNGADVHMETAPFSHPDPAREHRCTDWEIWSVRPRERVWFSECITGPQRLHAHFGDGAFMGALEGQRALTPDTEYVLRVRFRDNSEDEDAAWSAYAERRFRTRPALAPLPGAPAWLVAQDGYVVEEVAGGFRLPVNIAFVPRPVSNPDEPLFYVAELYGSIKVVYADFRVEDYATDLVNYEPEAKFPGPGEQGLTGITVEPETGDLLVSALELVGDLPQPRIYRLHSIDGGRRASSRTPVLEIPEVQGESHQISSLHIGPDGRLYAHNGDGLDIATARNLDSFGGKILRLELDGSPASDNPFYDASDGISARDYVFAYGLRNPFGGAFRSRDGALYAVDNGPSVDRLFRVEAGTDYGWDGTDQSMQVGALYLWEISVAPVNVAFVEAERFHGSGFPASTYGHAFVSESGPTYAPGPQELGKRITEFVLTAAGELSEVRELVRYNGSGHSTVAALAAGPDGLYFSELFPEDSALGPAGAGARIFRVRHDPSATASVAE